jgi:hypothetical protein
MDTSDSSKKRIKGKNKYILIIVVILVVIGTAFLVMNLTSRNQATSSIETVNGDAASSVEKVNGDPVSVEEFKLCMEHDRNTVITQFKNKYNANPNDKNFWGTSYSGEKPEVVLKQMALNECTIIKERQVLARELGLVDNITYSSLYNKYLKEKELRDKINAEKKKEGVGVPSGFQLDITYFYSNYWGSFDQMTKQKLYQIDYFMLTSEKLIAYYETIKNQYYATQDTVKVQMVAIPYKQDDPKSKDEASKKIEEAMAFIKSGESFEKTADLYNTGEMAKNDGEYEFNNSNKGSSARAFGNVYDEAMKLSTGQTSGIMDSSSGGFYILKCIGRQAIGIKSYDEVQSDVMSKYMETKFDEMINNRVKGAKVVINHQAVDAVKIQ